MQLKYIFDNEPCMKEELSHINVFHALRSAGIGTTSKRLVVVNILLGLLLGLCLITSCKQAAENTATADRRLTIVASIYPLFDFARAIGGDKVAVTMLLPPGSDAHHYEMTPGDIVRAGKADIFLFTSFEMEPWAHKVISAAAENTNMTALEAGQGTHLLTIAEHDDHDAVHHDAAKEEPHKHFSRYDPHIWLDFENARLMVDNITRTFIQKDPKNGDHYKKNAGLFKQRLTDLDNKYRAELTHCKSRTILHAGHWAFAYLARRYNIRYVAAYNISADAEPSPKHILALIGDIRSQKLNYIFYEDLTAPRLAQTIAGETGVSLLKLNNGHDIGKDDMQRGVTFIALMENNLAHLKKGMQCK